MANPADQIVDTSEIVEFETDGFRDPSETDLESDIAATKTATGDRAEFYVQMRSFTLADMETLIVEAAARQVMGRQSDSKLAKMIEARCIELTMEKANAALTKVTADIIDQPLTPSFGDKKPVTMREFIGLTGREYLTERVDREGKPAGTGWGSSNTTTRIEMLVGQYVTKLFKTEIKAATDAAIASVQNEIKAKHAEILAGEKQRLRDALAKVTAA